MWRLVFLILAIIANMLANNTRDGNGVPATGFFAQVAAQSRETGYPETVDDLRDVVARGLKLRLISAEQVDRFDDLFPASDPPERKLTEDDFRKLETL